VPTHDFFRSAHRGEADFRVPLQQKVQENLQLAELIRREWRLDEWCKERLEGDHQPKVVSEPRSNPEL
jgi:hypothetical protein